MRHAMVSGGRRSVLVIGLTSLLACESYVPAPITAATPNASVRVTLTEAGQTQLGGTVGARPAVLQGRVVETPGDTVRDTLRLAVQRITRVGGADEGGNGAVLAIPTRLIASVERRQVNVKRSWALAGAIAAGAVLVGAAIGGGDGSPLRGTPQSPTD